MARTRRREWAQRIREWKRSGLTGADFAARLGVKEATLRHWVWQLNHLARAARLAKKATAPAKFVEVQAPETAPEPLELVLRDGLRLRVPTHFDADSLRRVLAAVEGG
jgi:hypothetical protein